MTTRDYIYLGLILLAALAFYCNGFYAGVHRCKRMYDSPGSDDDAAGGSASGTGTPPDDKLIVQKDNIFAASAKLRDPKPLHPKRKCEWRGNFGNN